MQEHDIVDGFEARSPKDEDLTAEPNAGDGGYINENENNMLVVKNFVSAHSNNFNAPESMAVTKTYQREPTLVIASPPNFYDPAKTTLYDLPPTEYH